MGNTNPTPNMNLPVPIVLTDPGPEYARDINTCLTLLDSHNHTPGYGVPVPPSGLNINTDLTFGSNNATFLRSTRFVAQSSPLALGTDVGCLYVSGVDLYFNDINGNQVRITQSGGIAGTPGSIANLTSPASASYVAGSSTFVWQSNSNTPANLDAGSIILRNITANSKGLTLNPPASMAANYSLTLPSLPPGQQIMTCDASGNMAAPYTVDNATIGISANVIGVNPGGIGTTQLASGAVTSAKIAAGTIQQSNMAILGPYVGYIANSSASGTGVTSILSRAITTSGGSVLIMFYGNMNCTNSAGGSQNNGGTGYIYRDGVLEYSSSYIAGAPINVSCPLAIFTWLDVGVAAGNHTYEFRFSNSGSAGTTYFSALSMTTIEL